MNTILFSRSVGSSERFEKWDCSRTVASSKSAGGTPKFHGGTRIEAPKARESFKVLGGGVPLPTEGGACGGGCAS